MSSLSNLITGAKPEVAEVMVGGKPVHVRALGPSQSMAYTMALAEWARGEAPYPPNHVLVAMGLCENDGSPIPGKTTEQLTEELSKLSGEKLIPLALKVKELSGFGDNNVALERAEKNAKPAGRAAPAPAGVASRKDRRAAAARARRGTKRG